MVQMRMWVKRLLHTLPDPINSAYLLPDRLPLIAQAALINFIGVFPKTNNQEKVRVVPFKEYWLVKIDGEYFFTRSPNRLGDGKKSNMLRKYTLPGWIEVERNDTVVDGGAFIGGFTMAVADKARKVIAIEPDPQNYRVLRLNLKLRNLRNVIPLRLALSNRSGHGKLHLSRDPTSSSLLKTCDQNLGKFVKVKVARLDDLLPSLGIEKLDFLKLDAEGAEPEVLEGADLRRIRKMAIDCSAERFGKPTTSEVVGLLKNKFKVKVLHDMVYAKAR